MPDLTGRAVFVWLRVVQLVLCLTAEVGIASAPVFSVVSELGDGDEVLRPPRCVLSAWSKWDEACSGADQETSALQPMCICGLPYAYAACPTRPL
jgi:hypothetical protein